MKEDLFLKKAKELIQQKMLWGHWSEWTHYNFEKLQKAIEEKTNMHISITTLKRFFNKIQTDKAFTPNYNTKDTLAVFLGYHDWEAFKISLQKADNSIQIKTRRSPLRIKKLLLIFTSVLIIITLAYLIIYYAPDIFNPKIPLDSISISTDYKPDVYPQNVKINYHIPETNIKKFRLTFNDTNLDTSYNSQVLAPGKDIHNHYYSYPGTYVIKLFYEQKTIDEMVVSVLSDGWKINIQQHNPNPIRKVVHKKMNEHNYLKLSNQDVIKYGLDTNHYFETSFQIVDTFDINADSFMISLDMKNYTEEEEYYCDFNTLIIDTDNGSKIRYRIADPECQRNAKVSVNDLNLEGSKNDLELLTAPIHKWTNITIEARKPDMFFYINNQVVFNTIFRENLGKIRSVFAFFNTTGAIDNVTIYDGNHTAKHVWHFNKK